MRRTLALVLVALLALPAASAGEAARGGFEAREPLLFPAGSAGEWRTHAAYASDTSAARRFTLQAPVAAVERHEWRTQEVATAPGVPMVSMVEERSVDRFRLTHLRVTLEAGGSHGGWWLLQPGEDARVLLEASADLLVEPRGPAQVGSATTTGADDPRAAVSTPGPQLRLDAVGVLRAEGSLVLVVQGLDLLLEAQENRTTERTGIERGDAPVREMVERVLVLRLPQATLEAEGPAPLEVAAASGRVAWDGRLHFAPERGDLASGGARYDARGERAMLDGAFQATLAAAGGVGGKPLVRLDIEGDMRATSLLPRAEPGARTRVAGAPAWAWAAALLAAGGGVAAILARRGRVADLDPEEMVRLADRALEEERDREALRWYDRAAKAAPGSVRVRLGQAHCLGRLGRTRDALARYDACHSDGYRPEADLRAALLLLERGGSLHEAEARTARALDAAPALVLEADGRGFARLRGRPEFERARRAARLAMGDRPG